MLKTRKAVKNIPTCERAFYSALKSQKTAIDIRINFYARIKEDSKITFDLNINTWVWHVEMKKKIVFIEIRGSFFLSSSNYLNWVSSHHHEQPINLKLTSRRWNKNLQFSSNTGHSIQLLILLLWKVKNVRHDHTTKATQK